MKKRGFTLVELLVVIAILAILATVTTVGYVTFINNTNQQKADTEAAQIKKAIEGALIIGDSYYLGKIGEDRYYFSKYGVTAENGKPINFNDGITFEELCDELKSLGGTLTAYSNGNFKWTTDDGFYKIFNIDMGNDENNELPNSGVLQEYINSYFNFNSASTPYTDRLLLGLHAGSPVYLYRTGLIVWERSMTSSYRPSAAFEVDTSANENIHNITKTVQVVPLTSLMSSFFGSIYASSPSGYGYSAYITYTTNKDEEAVIINDTLCARDLYSVSRHNEVHIGNTTNGDEVTEWYVYRSGEKFYIGTLDENGEFENLDKTITIEKEDAKFFYGQVTISIDGNGNYNIFVKNGDYEETIVLDDNFINGKFKSQNAS